MPERLSSLRRALVDALNEGQVDTAAKVLSGLEDEANAALAAGELAPIVSIRGRMSRLRRAAAAADPHWGGLQRMVLLDRALGSAVTGLQVALRREMPVPLPEHVTEVSQRPAPRMTIRQRVLDALDDKPRRPIELGHRTGVSKRQIQRALRELAADGKIRTVSAPAQDDRAAFYQRVA